MYCERVDELNGQLAGQCMVFCLLEMTGRPPGRIACKALIIAFSGQEASVEWSSTWLGSRS